MGKQLLRLLTPLALILFALVFTSCGSSLSPWSDLNEKGDRVPHVALAPIKIVCKNPTPWDLSGELNFFFEKQLTQSGELKVSSSTFLRAHQRVPAPMLWHSRDLSPARLLLPHDFIVLSEVSKYQLIRESAEGVSGKLIQGAKNTKPFIYQIEAYVRVIDMTGPAPRLVVQEIFRLSVPVSAAQVQTDQTLKNWTSQHYFGGAHATVCAKLTSLLARPIEERILQAWSRRLPLSRYPKEVHSKGVKI